MIGEEGDVIEWRIRFDVVIRAAFLLCLNGLAQQGMQPSYGTEQIQSSYLGLEKNRNKGKVVPSRWEHNGGRQEAL